jgi:hypothetical protein
MSRLLDDRVSAAVKGPSAGGKSFVVETVSSFYPPSAVYALTAMSEHPLALHPENETRLLSIPITDTSEQTKQVLKALASDLRDPPDLRPWLALQEWLAEAEHRVVIGYVDVWPSLDRVPPHKVKPERSPGPHGCRDEGDERIRTAVSGISSVCRGFRAGIGRVERSANERGRGHRPRSSQRLGSPLAE